MLPEGYTVVELDDRVPNVPPELITRFKWRADKRCRRMNALREVPFYRYEVQEWHNSRWAVVVMQNLAMRKDA
jgi:hypothetical protein